MENRGNIRRVAQFSLAVAAWSSLSWAGEFHVAPGGDDNNPGTPAKPFTTLERARDAARQAGGGVVVLESGTYRRSDTLVLDARDSGTIWKGKPGTRIVGSIAVPTEAVKRVADQGILERVLPAARGKVMEIDLRALGVGDFGEIGPRGFRRPYVPAPLELFVDDVPLTVARWPNPGEPGVPIGKVLDKGPITRYGEKPTRGGVFEFATDRPARWTKAEDVWITGLFENGYADNTVKVKSFDLSRRTLTTVHPHMYGFAAGRPWQTWVALNLLEEIDQPGEFMADRASGKLYFLPPGGKPVEKCRLEISVVKEPLVAIEGATNVVFDGVDIECSRGMGVYIERGVGNRVQNATLRNLGIVAVCVGKGVTPDPDYRHGFTGRPLSRDLGSWHEHLYDNPAYNRDAGREHRIVNCRIYNIGAGAVSLGGGDRVTLQAGGNLVENCDIHDFNRWDRTYKAAVNIDGVGNIIRHCALHDCPGSAIYLHGNNNLIEFNEIHHAVLEGDDMGAFYMGRDPSERGTVIRYNYWHDLARQHGTFALYFDDAGGDGARVYGNVFRNAGTHHVVNINGGSDFLIEHNIFVDCPTAVRVKGIPGPWIDKDRLFEARLKAVRFNESPWKERYPEFQDYLLAHDVLPRRNGVCNNLLVRTPQDSRHCRSENNWVTDGDPGFRDSKGRDYGLRAGAEVFRKISGFQPVPFEKMGLEKTL